MLHVESANHVDAGFEQFQNILITLFVAAKRRVGMRQLIDDGHLRAAFENRIEIHLLDESRRGSRRVGAAPPRAPRSTPRYRAGRAVR